MRNLFLFLAGAFCGSLASHAQTFSPSLLSPSGGIDKTESVQVEWTVGEPAIETVSCSDKIYTEGFHQASLRVLAMETMNPVLDASYTITVAPNPVVTILTVHVQSKENEGVNLTLTDLNGKKIVTTRTAPTDSKDIDMSGLACALYILHVYNDGGNLIKSYKISKVQ